MSDGLHARYLRILFICSISSSNFWPASSAFFCAFSAALSASSAFLSASERSDSSVSTRDLSARAAFATNSAPGCWGSSCRMDELHALSQKKYNFRDPCIGDQNVETIADNAAGLLGKLVRAVRGSEICRYGVRTTTRLFYVSHDTLGFIRAAAVMHKNLSAGRTERECAGAAHAAGSACNKGGLA